VVIAAAGNKKTAAASDDNSIPGTAKLYTVKEGDSLWDIAASQLGDANRYKEIIKLNPDVSPDGKNLAVGTKLKIPTR
jgi:nucleoid-associated protein YgaU